MFGDKILNKGKMPTLKSMHDDGMREVKLKFSYQDEAAYPVNPDDYGRGFSHEGIASRGTEEQGRYIREKYGEPKREKFLGIF
jgi:hypothetical protein